MFRIWTKDYSQTLLLDFGKSSGAAKINRLKFVKHQGNIAIGILTSIPNEYAANTLTIIPNYG